MTHAKITTYLAFTIALLLVGCAPSEKKIEKAFLDSGYPLKIYDNFRTYQDIKETEDRVYAADVLFAKDKRSPFTIRFKLITAYKGKKSDKFANELYEDFRHVASGFAKRRTDSERFKELAKDWELYGSIECEWQGHGRISSKTFYFSKANGKYEFSKGGYIDRAIFAAFEKYYEDLE